MSTPSRRLRLLAGVLRAVPPALVTRAFTHPPRRRRTALAPRAITRRYDVVETRVGPGRVATVTPPIPHGSATSGHLFFLHGGAYALQDFHWPLLTRLLDRGWTVSLVDYPLLPEHTVDETVPMVVEAWQTVRAAHPGDRLCLAGDSAGGGLSLVLLQELRDRGLALPEATVLLSPWVDLVLEDAETRALARTDVVLPLVGLSRAARLYAGGRDLAHPWLSPVNGDLHGLGPIQAWVGTAELFLPQDRLLADRAAAAVGTELELHLGHGLPHDWALFPVPERDLLIEEMLAHLGR